MTAAPGGGAATVISFVALACSAANDSARALRSVVWSPTATRTSPAGPSLASRRNSTCAPRWAWNRGGHAFPRLLTDWAAQPGATQGAWPLPDRHPVRRRAPALGGCPPKALPVLAALSLVAKARRRRAVHARERYVPRSRDLRRGPGAHTAMTIFPWACPSPWCWRASGTSVSS